MRGRVSSDDLIQSAETRLQLRRLMALSSLLLLVDIELRLACSKIGSLDTFRRNLIVVNPLGVLVRSTWHWLCMIKCLIFLLLLGHSLSDLERISRPVE